MFSRYCLSVASSSYTTALYRVPLEAARNAVPDDYFGVAEIFPGEAVFFIGTGEFRKADLGPYMEMYIGFYTENRQRPTRPTQEDNLAEFSANESKMYMWKNWLTTTDANDRMKVAGSTVFRVGAIERLDEEKQTTFAMEHPTEGRIRFTTPTEGGLVGSDLVLQRTHYGRLHGVPSRLALDLNVDTMLTIPGQGKLVLEGEIADDCAPLEIPDQPLVSIWIEEMNFKMGKPVLLPKQRPEG
jgi:hypothetical protein